MAQPFWIKPLSEVLMHPTEEEVRVSVRTGNEYSTDVIRRLDVILAGAIEKDGEEYRYPIYDPKNQLEYIVKVSDNIEANFGTPLRLYDVVGGALNNGRGWYKANNIEVLKNA